MAFWIIVAVLTAGVAALLARAMIVRGQSAEQGAAVSDMAVYKDQLAEVDRDLARGVLTPDEAETVRVEVSRRLLEADRRANLETASARDGTPQGAGLILLLGIVVAGGVGVYAWLGAPGYGDLPLQTRFEMAEVARQTRPPQAEAEAQVGQPPVGRGAPELETLLTQLRTAVEARPDDLQGATLLANNEARQGRFIAARAAQENVIRLKGADATADDYLALLDFLVLAAGGYVSPEAEVAIADVLERDPGNGAARYYTGLMLAQIGRPDQAFTVWRALLEDSPATAPWINPIRAQIGDLARLAGVRYEPPPALSGPTDADIAAAESMSPEDRAAMVQSMVDGLSDRLANEGGSASEWARLITALAVLGQTERATAILTEARSAFASDVDSLTLIEEAATAADLR